MKADAKVRSLKIRRGDKTIGLLFDTDPLSFQYLLLPNPDEQIPGVPFEAGKISTSAINGFFENLLPEGLQRTFFETKFKSQSVFQLLSHLGRDCAGAYLIEPSENQDNIYYEPITWEQLKQRLQGHSEETGKPLTLEEFSNIAGDSIAKLVIDQFGQTKLSGAQNKFGLYIDASGNPYLPQNGASSTHIVKPEIQRPDLKIFASAYNEYFVMKLAHACGLKTAEVQYQGSIKSTLVKRFDREVSCSKPLQIKRIAQYDFCQIHNIVSDKKYEKDGGPSLLDCWNLIGEKSHQVLRDRKALIQWMCFNLLTGCADGHGKNLSMQILPNGKHVLSPFYDLMCTQVYSGLGSENAMSIGDEFSFGKIGAREFQMQAQRFKVKPELLFNTLGSVSKAIESELPILHKSEKNKISPHEKIIFDRLFQKINSQNKKITRRVLDSTS